MGKIGILGGCFSPIHSGHINLAQQALDEYHLDLVYFMVTGAPYHKDQIVSINRFQRYEMVKETIESNPSFKALDIELFDATPSYTANTLKKLKDLYPHDELFYIMGEDSIDYFETWVEPNTISALATILVAPRNNGSKDNLKNKLSKLNKDFPGEFFLLDAKYFDISSTKIRNAIIAGTDTALLDKYLPAKALSYIKAHRLYSSLDEYDIDFITDNLKFTLKEKRYNHTMRVADTASFLASCYNYPTHIAYVAGLLHDCGKYFDWDGFLDYCKTNNIDITETEKEAPYLLHSKVGMHLAETKYGVSDKEILHSILVHTTGCPNMSLLDKIVYVADYIEPGRKHSKILNEVRPMAIKNIDVAIIMILKDTIEYLKEGNRPIDDTTARTLAYYTGENYENN